VSTKTQRPDLDRQIASLYFQIDTALRGGRLDTVDKLLLRLSTRPTYKAEYLIAALTATLPAKSKLKYRQNLVWLTARILKHEGIDPHVILHGLA
jgi:predicted site-specific integrase-resolvase